MTSRVRPLDGRRILVTRRPEQAGVLVERLRELGAAVSEVPLIEVSPPEDQAELDEALRDIRKYQWLVFTSANAVKAVKARLAALGLEDSLLRAVSVAVVGPSTGEAFRREFPGIEVALQPRADFRAEGLLAAFGERDAQGRFLLPVSDRARDLLARGLRSRGASVDVVVAYRTVAPRESARRIEECLRTGTEIVTFASPTAVENFVAIVKPEWIVGLRAAVIGPVTEAAARDAGIEVCVVASPSTVEALVAGLERYFSGPE